MDDRSTREKERYHHPTLPPVSAYLQWRVDARIQQYIRQSQLCRQRIRRLVQQRDPGHSRAQRKPTGVPPRYGPHRQRSHPRPLHQTIVLHFVDLVERVSRRRAQERSHGGIPQSDPVHVPTGPGHVSSHRRTNDEGR
jgi:hypothetical protein